MYHMTSKHVKKIITSSWRGEGGLNILIYNIKTINLQFF